MIDYLLWFPIIWILSFICHEYMHVFEHMRQGGKSYRVELWWWHGLPSMHVYLSGIQLDPRRVSLAGGLYTSFIHLVVLFTYVLTFGFNQTGFVFSLMCVGLVQFCYGYFEMEFINIDTDDYMALHYLLYSGVISVFCIVWVSVGCI